METVKKVQQRQSQQRQAQPGLPHQQEERATSSDKLYSATSSSRTQSIQGITDGISRRVRESTHQIPAKHESDTLCRNCILHAWPWRCPTTAYRLAGVPYNTFKVGFGHVKFGALHMVYDGSMHANVHGISQTRPPDPERLRCILQELLTTEVHYVARLRTLLNVRIHT
jgi:hypothetical protein